MKDLERTTHCIPLGDGDHLAAWYFPGKSDRLMYLFHGLGGQADTGYMHRLVRRCHEGGDHVLAVNHRGCGTGAGLARGLYHSGRAEDLSAVFAYGRTTFSMAQHLAIGFSLSGNALLLLLAGERGTVLPDGGISVNAPIDLHSACVAVHRGLNRIYESRFVILCNQAVKQRARFGLLPPQPNVPPWASLYEFDRVITAPLGGFRDPEDYYDTCSTNKLLDRIRTPTVVLTARDDPFVPVADYEAAPLSDQVHLHIAEHGGHMGYLTRRGGIGYARWMDETIMRYLTLF